MSKVNESQSQSQAQAQAQPTFQPYRRISSVLPLLLSYSILLLLPPKHPASLSIVLSHRAITQPATAAKRLATETMKDASTTQMQLFVVVLRLALLLLLTLSSHTGRDARLLNLHRWRLCSRLARECRAGRRDGDGCRMHSLVLAFNIWRSES